MPKRINTITLLLILVMAACGPLREVVTPDPDVSTAAVSRTLSAMRDNETSFDFFATRFSGYATIENTSYNLSGSIRIRKDSAIFISVSPLLGIEMARILVTPEEVRFINRLEGTYFVGDMGFINSMLNTTLDFYMLQSILVGNDFSHFSSDNFKVSADRGRILLQNPGRYPKNMHNPGFAFQQNIWLDPDSHRIAENLLYDPVSRRSLRSKYERFDRVDDQYVPREIVFLFVEPGARTELSLRYSRTSINEPQSITFSIPDRYMPLMD
ncbi:MAG: DUF4292 domain-containing protein [Bacteroidia bacterium]|nr:MAG: DUF4292 domain-containing protein [Bacteroidia bacterium]